MKVWQQQYLVLVLVLYLFVSVRFPFRNTPSANVAGSVATLGPNKVLFTETFTPYHFTFGIGAGRVVPTFDEMMLLSGNAFYPFFIREYKEMLLESRANVCEVLDSQDSAIVVNVGWESSAFYPFQRIITSVFSCKSPVLPHPAFQQFSYLLFFLLLRVLLRLKYSEHSS